MQQIYPDLWQTSAEQPLAQFPDTRCHAYLLTRRGGNVLFYMTGRQAMGNVQDVGDLDMIAERGGVAHVLLAHWHEASPSLKIVKERFGATIVAHARDAAMIAKEGGVAPDRTFWDRCDVVPNIEAIPTPGHTVGSACYLHRSPYGKAYLFTGDTIWPARESWASVTFEDDAKQTAHRASLDLLAELSPDVVMAAVAPDEAVVEIAPYDWPAATAAAKASLG